ncbi:MAG: hypothetical protein R3A79_28040 [Nannocystaceae bacterium]
MFHETPYPGPAAGPPSPPPDDEAPTAFYRRPKRRGAAPQRRPPTQSPATLLLPTSEARDVTSDGTILAPLREGAAAARVAAPGWIERPRAALSRLWRATALTPASSSVLSGVVAFTFFGLLGVVYIYMATGSRRDGPGEAAQESASRPADEPGAIARALDLSLRSRSVLRRAETKHDS